MYIRHHSLSPVILLFYFFRTIFSVEESLLIHKNESLRRDSPPAAGRNMRHVSYPPQCDPRGAFFYVMETKFPIT